MIMKTRLFKTVSGEQGEIAVLIACYLVILMLCLGLTLDLGNTYLLHLKMRNAADLAAASIGAKLPEDNTDQNAEELCALAERIVEDNGIDLSTTAINCEILREDKIIYAAKVILTCEVQHAFASLYTHNSSSIRVGDFVYITKNAAGESGYTIQIVDA